MILHSFSSIKPEEMIKTNEVQLPAGLSRQSDKGNRSYVFPTISHIVPLIFPNVNFN